MPESILKKIANETGRRISATSGRQTVCIQGLGFVGSAMALAVASARDEDGNPRFNVIGVELPDERGRAKAAAINAGRLPVEASDGKLQQAIQDAYNCGNLIATTDKEVFSVADITIVDIPLDMQFVNGEPSVDYSGFERAIDELGDAMPAGSLVIIETTVPPGTCAQIVAPRLANALERRSLPPESILLAHSYERVMPGDQYLDSIINYWRVYAGHTLKAADRCEDFLKKIINTDVYPLTRLDSTTASETAKVLENSYRAVNIAFIEEWGRFAESAGFDLYQVIEAIRMRPTHANIRQPGFGVGGYCLTKDPLMGWVACRQTLKLDGLEFPFSSAAVKINQAMPDVTVRKLQVALGGNLEGKNLLLLGISYRQAVSDTRFSPSEQFYRQAAGLGAQVQCHDPFVTYWSELDLCIDRNLPPPEGLDAVVLAVPHAEYRQIDFKSWLGGCRPLIFDANNVLTAQQREVLHGMDCRLAGIGRGEPRE